MKEIKRAARKLLFELGAPVNSKGFGYAVEILCDGVVNQTPIVYRPSCLEGTTINENKVCVE